VIKDEQPDKGRALRHLEEKQGRTIDKSGGAKQHQSVPPDASTRT
jgi:hypothetical protein